MQDVKFKNINIFYNKKKNILNNINIEIKGGSFSVILGKNGSGKSSLAKSMLKLVGYKGDIMLGQKNIRRMRAKQLAKQVGYISQINSVTEGVTCFDYVAAGRNPHTNLFGVLSQNDRHKINEVFAMLEINEIKYKHMDQVSGGQLQRLSIALGLVQETDILVVDEPTNHLDPKSVLNIIDILKKINDQGKTIILISHELEHGLKYADQVFLVKDQKVFKSGEPCDVIKEKNIKKLFGVNPTIQKEGNKCFITSISL